MGSWSIARSLPDTSSLDSTTTAILVALCSPFTAVLVLTWTIVASIQVQLMRPSSWLPARGGVMTSSSPCPASPRLRPICLPSGVRF